MFGVEVLYRTDDVWDIAKENTSGSTSVNGTYIEPYYTTVKNEDGDGITLGLIVPYTVVNKQNLNSYLIGTCDPVTGKESLSLFSFAQGTAILRNNAVRHIN